jgi:hypothetical protein
MYFFDPGTRCDNGIIQLITFNEVDTRIYEAIPFIVSVAISDPGELRGTFCTKPLTQIFFIKILIIFFRSDSFNLLANSDVSKSSSSSRRADSVCSVLPWSSG